MPSAPLPYTSPLKANKSGVWKKKKRTWLSRVSVLLPVLPLRCPELQHFWLFEKVPRAFFPWHTEDGGYGLGMFAGTLEPQSPGWLEQGLAASRDCSPLPSPCRTWLTFGFLCVLTVLEPGSARRGQLWHIWQKLCGCHWSLPQEWVCLEAEAAAAWPQTQQGLLWDTSAPKMVWLNWYFNVPPMFLPSLSRLWWNQPRDLF